MTVDVINVDSCAVKKSILRAFEKLNGIGVKSNTGLLSVESVCDNNVMLQDPNSKRGVILRKVSIREMFPKTISIRPFKDKLKINTTALEPDGVAAFNAKHNSELVSAEKDVLQQMSQAPIEAIRDFILFCRVYGFYELDIGDITIFKIDGVLTISVNDTHKFFKGYIEVLV